MTPTHATQARFPLTVALGRQSAAMQLHAQNVHRFLRAMSGPIVWFLASDQHSEWTIYLACT
jgi:hypothetical protein